MGNGDRTGNGYVPIVGVEAASDPNAIYITANEPESKPKQATRRCTKEFYFTIDSITQYRKVGEDWVRIPPDEEQPFIVPDPLPKRERVEAGCFYYLYIRPNPAYKGTERVRAEIRFTVSDEGGGYATTATYIHWIRRR